MSIFGKSKKYSIDDEIAKLYDELATINETKQMVNTSWWVKVRNTMLDKIIVLDKEIISLASDTVKNGDAIRIKHSLRMAIKGLLSVVETTLDAEEEITKKLEKLEEVAKRSELMR